jgi:hypothetical protein
VSGRRRVPGAPHRLQSPGERRYAVGRPELFLFEPGQQIAAAVQRRYVQLSYTHSEPTVVLTRACQLTLDPRLIRRPSPGRARAHHFR